MLRYTLITLAALILLFVFTMGSLLGILWWRPHWLINESTIRWAQERFFPEYEVPWDKLDLKIEKLESGVYAVFLAGSDFCQSLGPYGKACFDELLLDAEVATDFKSLKNLYIKNIILKDQVIAITVPSQPDSQQEPLDLSQLKTQIKRYTSYLDKIKIGAHEILLDQTSVEFESSAAEPINIQIVSNDGLAFEITSNALHLKGNLKKLESHFGLNISTAGSFGKITVDTEIQQDFSQIHGGFEFYPQTDGLKKILKEASTDFSVNLTNQDLSLRLNTLLVDFSYEPLKDLRTARCQIALALSMEKDIQLLCEKIDLNFDLTQLDFKNLKPEMKDFPKTLTFRLNSTLPISWLKESPLSSDESLSISIKAEPIQHELFQFDLAAQTGIQLSKDGWSLDNPSLNVSLLISRFQNLVSRLEGSRFAIPAPFHVLKGSLRAEVKEIPKASSDVLNIPFHVNSNLTSERNAVVGDVQGRLEYYFPPSKTPASLSLDVSIDQLHVQLPPFDPVRGIPSLTPDPRITQKLERKSQEPQTPINLDLRVRTTKPDAIRLYHKFIEPFASFGLTANVEKETGFRITKSANDFKINYLNRSVTVKNLRLNKKSNQRDIHVAGQLLYEAAGYDVFINIAGPTDRPEVVLTSDPPLERRDIISVLLYNRVNDDIASFEQENVGGTEAAIADRAIGLFGIWAFASTPIEAVSYNSVTGTYSAQIKLPEGFRFSIGTDWESVQNLELRRRISGPWIVSTIYRPQTDEDESAGEIMLQRKTSY